MNLSCLKTTESIGSKLEHRNEIERSKKHKSGWSSETDRSIKTWTLLLNVESLQLNHWRQ